MRILLGLAVLLAACDSHMEPRVEAEVEAFLNVPFSLSPGQTAVLAAEHLSLTFVSVLDDSRCPVDTVCVNAGDATMAFQATLEGSSPSELRLTLTDDPHANVYEGFGIHVHQLSPERRSDRAIRPEEYRVVVLVDRP